MAVNDSLQIKDPVAGTDVDLELAAGAGGKARPVVHIDSGDALPLPTNAAQETGGNLAGLVTRVGEVQASPTANSVLARLKDLLTGIVLAAGSAIIGKVGIDQTTPGTTNRVDVGTLPALAAGAAVVGKVGIDQTTPGTTNRVDIGTIAAGENHVGAVGGHSVTVTGTVTRPADTTQYAAGDVISNSTSAPVVITFPGCARVNAGGGVIIGAQCVDDTNQTTKATLELWLFDTTVTPDNDNAVFTPTDAELLTLVGIIRFSTWFVGDATAAAGGNAVALATLANPLTFKCGAALTALLGVLVVRNAYTPVSAEVFSIRLRILQD